VARPIPEPAPDTRATLPSKRTSAPPRQILRVDDSREHAVVGDRHRIEAQRLAALDDRLQRRPSRSRREWAGRSRNASGTNLGRRLPTIQGPATAGKD
jgi:hypothetical protein